MSDYNTGDFWNEEDAAFWDEIGPIAVEIFHEAGASGAEALPDGLEILFDPNYYNEQAVDWLRKYKLEHIRGIMDTTRKNAINIIDEWVRSGEHMDILTAKLDKLFGAPRGKSIAVTEVTRMYADGNTAAWENTGVVGEKRWNAAVDELVCPVCGEFHDTTRALDGGWFWLGGVIEGPPAHPNCRCYLTPVVSDELYERELERVLGERPGGGGFTGDYGFADIGTATGRALHGGDLGFTKSHWVELSQETREFVVGHEIAHSTVEDFILKNMSEWDLAEKTLEVMRLKDGRMLFAGGHTRLGESISDMIGMSITNPGNRIPAIDAKKWKVLMKWATDVTKRAGYDTKTLSDDVIRIVKDLNEMAKVK